MQFFIGVIYTHPVEPFDRINYVATSSETLFDARRGLQILGICYDTAPPHGQKVAQRWIGLTAASKSQDLSLSRECIPLCLAWDQWRCSKG